MCVIEKKLQYLIMRSFIYILSLCFIFLVSCTKDDVQKACYNEGPVEELEWLSSKVSELETDNFSRYNYIKLAEYKGELIFIVGSCNPSGFLIFNVYNCSGDKIGQLGDQFSFNILENAKVIWKSNNSQCNFD